MRTVSRLCAQESEYQPLTPTAQSALNKQAHITSLRIHRFSKNLQQFTRRYPFSNIYIFTMSIYLATPISNILLFISNRTYITLTSSNYIYHVFKVKHKVTLMIYVHNLLLNLSIPVSLPLIPSISCIDCILPSFR